MARRTQQAGVHEFGDAELLEQLASRRQELFNLRFQVVTGELDKHHRIKEVKRGIARILTELREREIAAAEALAAAEKGSAS